MTCKDCIYEPKCILRISYFMGDDEITGKELADMGKRCKSFKNKADFVETIKVVEMLCKIKTNIIKSTSTMIENNFDKIVKDVCGERKENE